MSGIGSTPEQINASVWRRPYSARERLLLHEQAKYDRRNFPALWLWRLLLPDEPDGVSPDEVLWESPRISRKYADPVPVHIYVNWTRVTKSGDRGGVSSHGIVPVAISRAEARRLGRVFGTHDDLEILVSDGDVDHLYLPRPGDVFRFADDHFIVLQWGIPIRYGPTNLIVTWEGTASFFEEDTTAPGFGLQQPPTSQPPLAPAPRFAWRG